MNYEVLFEVHFLKAILLAEKVHSSAKILLHTQFCRLVSISGLSLIFGGKSKTIGGKYIVGTCGLKLWIFS